MMVLAYNPSTQKAETGGSGVQGQPELRSKTKHCLKKTKRSLPEEIFRKQGED
jgi:hypothetical protein